MVVPDNAYVSSSGLDMCDICAIAIEKLSKSWRHNTYIRSGDTLDLTILVSQVQGTGEDTERGGVRADPS